MDSLNRCGVATACLGLETLPPEGGKRRAIAKVHPTGWHATTYDTSLVSGESLYNRTHLIAWCLGAEGPNRQNLITGTEYLNQEAMLPLETRVADYIRQSGNHVLYRVTPVFQGSELVARGVQMEARSVEDEGAGVSFNVFCYNVQPGVAIDYATGESRRDERVGGALLARRGYLIEGGLEPEELAAPDALSYTLNFNTRRFHLMTCRSTGEIASHNKGYCRLDRDTLMALGYVSCGRCRP